MLTQVSVDTRGLVRPDVGLRRFRLTNFTPSPDLDCYVECYWVAEWDLPEGHQHVQHVLPHPAANVCFEAHGASVHGVNRGQSAHRLEGNGRAVGITFRPGGFRPFLARPMSTLTDASCSLGEAFGGSSEPLERHVHEADGEAAVNMIDRFLADLAGGLPPHDEELVKIVELVVSDRSLLRVDALAREAAMSPRGLERLFKDRVGVGPKWVIRRYRLFEAAERALRETDVSWSRLAADLGYSDQAHLIRDFRSMFGMTPRRYMAGA